MTETVAAPAAPAAPPAAPAAPSIAWLPDADTDTVGFVQNKGFAGPGDVLKAYRNLETTFGADRAGRTIVLPKDDADPVELNAFHERLGRPSTADGYKLPVPEGQSADFAKAVAGWMHEAGISQKAGQALAAKWNEFQAQQDQAAKQAEAEAVAQEKAALARDWGNEMQMRTELAHRALKQLALKAGIDAERANAGVDAIGAVFGGAAALKIMALMGDSMREHGAEGLGDLGSFGMTPEGARARLAEIKANAASDPAYSKRLGMKGSAEWAEVTKLNRVITGG